MDCSWTEDDDSYCDGEITLRWKHIPLCEFHRTMLGVQVNSVIDSHIAKLYEIGQLQFHSSGYTYIALLPSGRIKIGYSGRAEILKDRWTKLSREFDGRLTILAVLDGGRTLEACLHYQFGRHRIPDSPLEQFNPDDELLEYALRSGIDPSAQESVLDFIKWKPRKELLSKRLGKIVTVRTPLSVSGRNVVDASGTRVKLIGANWAGHFDPMIPCGLDYRDRRDIAAQLAGWGINHIRLTFAQKMITYTGKVDPKLVSANPDLVGKTPYEVYKACAQALTDAGIIVIPNMHLLYPGWCCSGVDGNGLPYNDNWPIASFYSAWTRIATDFAANPLVAGFDLFNECRPTMVGGVRLSPSWGDNNAKTDMRLFYQTAATSIHRVSPEKLIICEGLNYAGDLTKAKALPVSPANKTVYSLHDYSWFHSPGQFYGDFKIQMDAKGGYLSRDNVAPVWIGEFGVNTDRPSNQSGWWNNFLNYARERDLDVCLWHVDGTVHTAHEPVTNALKAEEGQREAFSLYASDWLGPSSPWILKALQSLIH